MFRGDGTGVVELVDLLPGTTYYWKIVSKTMANKTATPAQKRATSTILATRPVPWRPI